MDRTATRPEPPRPAATAPEPRTEHGRKLVADVQQIVDAGRAPTELVLLVRLGVLLTEEEAAPAWLQEMVHGRDWPAARIASAKMDLSLEHARGRHDAPTADCPECATEGGIR